MPSVEASTEDTVCSHAGPEHEPLNATAMASNDTPKAYTAKRLIPDIVPQGVAIDVARVLSTLRGGCTWPLPPRPPRLGGPIFSSAASGLPRPLPGRSGPASLGAAAYGRRPSGAASRCQGCREGGGKFLRPSPAAGLSAGGAASVGEEIGAVTLKNGPA